MKKISLFIAQMIALISIACQSYTLVDEAKMTISQVESDVNSNPSTHNKPMEQSSNSPDPSTQGYLERIEQQKIDDTLKSLNTNSAGAKYAQFIKDNDIQVVWGTPEDCDGANFCSSENKIIMNRDWAGESPELLSGFITHETVHQMTPVEEGSSLYEEYRAYQAEDQVREAYKDNKGFDLQKSGFQEENRNPNIDPHNAIELEGWFKKNGLYDAYRDLPVYPAGYKYPIHSQTPVLSAVRIITHNDY
jgi:hypothetical protein